MRIYTHGLSNNAKPNVLGDCMKKVIVGYLRANSKGYSFEFADESAGTEANTFASEIEAQAALDELGWDAEIYTLDELKELGLSF